MLSEQVKGYIIPRTPKRENHGDIGLVPGLGVDFFEGGDDSPGGMVQLLAGDARDEEIALDLRLRKDDFYKKLVEEILPIASFLGTFERVDLNVECEYFSGDQSYDAKIYCDGLLVEKGSMRKEYFLEISVSQCLCS